MSECPKCGADLLKKEVWSDGRVDLHFSCSSTQEQGKEFWQWTDCVVQELRNQLAALAADNARLRAVIRSVPDELELAGHLHGNLYHNSRGRLQREANDLETIRLAALAPPAAAGEGGEG